MDDYLITIVMPVYNTGIVLRETLDSILGQTYKKWKLICVDDGSTDRITLNELQSAAETDQRMQIVHNPHCLGAAAARNIGLKLVSTRYVTFWDSDDIFESSLLENMLNTMESEPGIDVVICAFRSLDANTGKSVDSLLRLSSPITDKAFNISDLHVQDPFGGMYLNPWNKLVRTELLKQKKIEFQNIKCCNDVFFSIMVLGVAHRVKYCKPSTPLVTYRCNTGKQLSSNRNPWFLWLAVSNCMVQEELFEYLDSILEMWFLASVEEIDFCKEEEIKQQYYEFMVKYLSNSKMLYSKLEKNPLIKACIGNPKDYRWMYIPSERYYQEILNSGYDANSFQGNSVVLWGNGVRSQALQRFLSERGIYGKVADIKDEHIGENTRYGFMIVSSAEIMGNERIIATNHEIFSDVSNKFNNTWDLESICQ